MTARVLMVVATLVLGFVTDAAVQSRGRRADAARRWKTWKADLGYLCDEIGKPASLKQILKTKGIKWKATRKRLEKRFAGLARAARKRGRDDFLADEVAYYGLLREVIASLRDGHAFVEVDKRVRDAWQAAQPRLYSAGVELMPGSHGTVVVAHVNPGDPVAGRGITHEATLLDSVNGQDAARYFSERGAALLEQGRLSTLGRATLLAMHRLEMAKGEKLELVFRVLQSSEKESRKYVGLKGKKRVKAFKSLKWKKKKLTLRYAQCARARNPWSFRCQNARLPELTKTAGGKVASGRLPSGFGYVAYTGVSKAANEALASACRGLADCPGLVLDMRRNGGGGDGDAASVFEQKNGTWGKPVAVLIGPWTMSAGETEVWELKRLRTNHRCNARFFGTTTAGASGDKIRWALPSGFAKGRFVYRHWHNEQSKIEGVGCAPDVQVDQDVVELSLGIGSHIHAAERWLRKESGGTK